MGAPVKNQVENGISNLFDFQGQTIDVSDQEVSPLKDSGLHDDEGEQNNVSDQTTVAKRRSSSFCILLLRSTQTRRIQTASRVV